MKPGDIFYDSKHPERGCFVIVKPIPRGDKEYDSAVAFDGDGIPVYTLAKDYVYVGHMDIIDKMFSNLDYCDRKWGLKNDKN